MTCIIMKIKHEGDDKFTIECDKTRTDTATDREIRMANMFDTEIDKLIYKIADKIISESHDAKGAE